MIRREGPDHGASRPVLAEGRVDLEDIEGHPPKGELGHDRRRHRFSRPLDPVIYYYIGHILPLGGICELAFADKEFATAV